jgi:hypothetical protein
MGFFNKQNQLPKTQNQAEEALRLLQEITGRNRRSSMQKRMDYYYDKQLAYLENALNTQFSYPERMKLQKEISNITKMIIDEQGIIYNEEPVREIIEGTAKDVETYEQIVKDSGLNLIMQQVNKFVKLFKTVAVRPVWRDNGIQYDIYTPNIYDVFQDPLDTTKAEAFVWGNVIDLNNEISINNDDVRGERDPWDDKNNLFYYMDKEHFIVFSLRFDVKSKKFIANVEMNDDNIENINPYNEITFVTMRDGIPVDNYFLEGGDELVNTNEIINVKITENNYLTKMQSFSIPVRKGADDNSGVIIFDPSTTIDLPADDDVSRNADFKFVSPEAKIEEMENVVNNKIKALAVKNGLSPERFTTSAQKSSAEALQLRAWDQAKIVKGDKPYYARYEQELFEKTKIVWNYHNDKDQISETAKLFIDYKEIETPMTVEERDTHNIILYTNGLLSKKSWLMKENPDIKSEEQADQMLEEISKQKKDDLAEQVQLPETNPPLEAENDEE